MDEACVAKKPTPAETQQEKLARRKAAEEEAALREIDEAVRQSEMEEFGQKYGKPLLAVFVLGMALFGGYLFWQNQQDAAREADAEIIIGALDQVEAGNLQTAGDQLEPLVQDGSDAAQASAALLQAGIAAQDGNTQRAAELFAAVANNESAPDVMRNIALIRQISTQFDTMDKGEVIAALEPLAQPGEPFFGSAGELVAVAHLEQGNNAEAGALFAAISKADDVPDSVRARARQMAGVLGVDAIEDVEAVLEAQGVDTEVGAPDAAQ